ncbi:MAG: porphyrinogen peroxidase [Frankiales bacterium]|nr:porphyrinogen peroxidase [Frankiales bacterium]
MATAQLGIFALGTVEHFYVELDLVPGGDPSALVRGLAALVGPGTTVRGVNVVVGVRPSIWARLSGNAPADAADFDEDIVGAQGMRMPATQHDAWLWISGGARDAVFDAGLAALATLNRWAFVSMELNGWLYRHDRDLTGFIDGTENPSLLEAYAVAVVPSGPGAGSSVVLVQQWKHQSEAFMQLPVEAQERIIGRSKDDSIELDPSVMPPTSHVSRTVLERDGVELPIFRRNTAYGGVTDHGTLFVGFSQEQFRLTEMLRRMAGVGDGVRDALTRFTTPLTGAYYVCPAADELLRLSPEE